MSYRTCSSCIQRAVPGMRQCATCRSKAADYRARARAEHAAAVAADPDAFCSCGRRKTLGRNTCGGVHHERPAAPGPYAHITNDPGSAGERCARCRLTGHDADGCDLRHGAQWFAVHRPEAGT